MTTGDQRPSTADVLQRARELIAQPEKWCQHKWSVQNGTERICANEAMRRAADNRLHIWESAWKAFAKLHGDVAAFNDTHSHAEVLEAFDRAITKATGAA